MLSLKMIALCGGWFGITFKEVKQKIIMKKLDRKID